MKWILNKFQNLIEEKVEHWLNLVPIIVAKKTGEILVLWSVIELFF